MDPIGTILFPIKWVIEAILVGFHTGLEAIGLSPEAGLTWVLSIVGLVLVVRAALIPIFVRQIKSQRKMLEVAPQLKKIQDKYRGKKDQFSREAMQRETMALYQRAGTNPLSSCLPPTARSGCDLIVSHFRSEFGSRVAALRYLVVVPALAGLLLGAPLLAREFEHGTHRLAWTQGVTRRRWLLSKSLLLALGSALGGVALAALAMWWRQPFDNLDGRMGPSAFDVEGLVVPAYAVAALAFGVLAGLGLRRTLPAMSLAVGLFLLSRLGVEKLLRPHYLAPAHRSVPAASRGDFPEPRALSRRRWRPRRPSRS